MRRSLVLVLTLFALLWQGLAGASLSAWPDLQEGAEHAALHWSETSHHHGEDGSHVLDESSASVAHVSMDGWSPTILTLEPLHVPRIRLTHVQPNYVPMALAAPFLARFPEPPRR